jgi:Uma2 family endonuclease
MNQEIVYREPPYKVKKPRKISIETFLRKYRDGAPGIKYEYNNGIVEPSDTVDLKDFHIVYNLRKQFEKSVAAQMGDSLECETEIWTSSSQLRKPSLSFFTLEQIRAGFDGFQPIPAFLIELISSTDTIGIVHDKVSEYLAAGVKIIWLIFPNIHQVQIHKSNSPSVHSVCSDDQICSAEPVAEGFKIKAADIFKRP